MIKVPGSDLDDTVTGTDTTSDGGNWLGIRIHIVKISNLVDRKGHVAIGAIIQTFNVGRFRQISIGRST